MSAIAVHHGDSREVLKGIADASIDACVCDPPYALVSIGKRFGKEGAAPAKAGKTGAYARASAGFMGQKWDTGETAFDPGFWKEVYRVLKPGGHVLAFSATRTYHRLACAVEDAGFEIRDMVAWLYGSGFPKSHSVSKAITKRPAPAVLLEIKIWLATQFERSGKSRAQINRECGFTASDYLKTEPGNDAGGRATWHLLIPHGEKWAKMKAVVGFDETYDAVVAELADVLAKRSQPKATKEIYGRFSGVVTDFNLTDEALQWEGWGTALKPALEPIVFARKPLDGTVAANVLQHGTGALNIEACRVSVDETADGRQLRVLNRGVRKGDDGWGMSAAGADQPACARPEGRWPANVVHDGTDEVLSAFPDAAGQQGVVKGTEPSSPFANVYGDVPDRAGRAEPRGDSGSAARFFYTAKADAEDRLGSKHPTVKPVGLMRWLCRLVTPPCGVILDPFAGTGTTGLAAYLEGFDAILIEREKQYVADIHRRMAWVKGEGRLMAQEMSRVETRPVEGLPLFGGDAA